MRWWRVVPFLASLAVTLTLLASASAGGWSVVTLDRLPATQAPGSELQLGFTVRQHGIRPVTGTNATVRLTNHSSGDRLTVYAQPDGLPGHYRAFVTLNAPGRWDWTINVFEGDHAMPPLQVGSPGQPVGSTSRARATPTPMLWMPLALVAVLSGAGALLLTSSWRPRARMATVAR